MTDTKLSRQDIHRAKLTALGYLRMLVWLPGPIVAQLKERYPGPRGGVNWEQVALAALRKRRTTSTNEGAAP